MPQSVITRLKNNRPVRFPSLARAMGTVDLSDETWLFISSHDDDLCMGCGLLIQQALVEGVDVRVLIVTDDRMGYCTLKQRDTITDIRRAETIESFEILGITDDRLGYVGYPDGRLCNLRGRRKAYPGENAIAGHVGLQNAFTRHLRAARVTRVFVPTSTDLHPDHQITHNELMISIFHAAGTIWPELGEPLREVPKVYELAVYCDFPERWND